MDHVHLVVISKVVRDIDPSATWLRDLRVDGSLEARHPREDFGRYSKILLESSFELSET